MGIFAPTIEKNALYRCLDKVLPYRAELFDHLRQRWQDLFGARSTFCSMT